MGRMMRIGTTDLSRNPVVPVLPGTVGTRGSPFPSFARGIGVQHPTHLDMVDA
jgi:hypothetical protein